jgi:hypothetical protein
MRRPPCRERCCPGLLVDVENVLGRRVLDFPVEAPGERV